MKSERGITLTSLVVYVTVATAIIGCIAMVSTFFMSNMNTIKDQEKYAPEVNYFNMFFIEDVKNNRSAEVTNTTVEFEDGTKYEYKQSENAIYRNSQKIVEEVQAVSFTSPELEKTETIITQDDLDTPDINEEKKVVIWKQIIKVDLSVGLKKTFHKTVEYTLKYW